MPRLWIALIAATLLAQFPAPSPDWTKVEGKVLKSINPEDMGAVGILALGVSQGAKMNPEQQALYRAATQATGRRDFDTAYRLVSRFLLSMGGVALSEQTEVASSFDLTLPRVIVTPGEPFAARLEPLFALPAPPSGTYQAELSLAPRGGKTKSLGSESIKDFQTISRPIDTRKLKPGAWEVRYRLLSPKGEVLIDAARGFVVAEKAASRISTLQAQFASLRDAAGADRTALESLEWLVDRLRDASGSYATDMLTRGHPMLLRALGPHLGGIRTAAPAAETPAELRNLRTAEKLARALQAGQSPWKSLSGDLLLAYRSDVDQKLQPFRLFVPEPFDPARKYPLIVTLHGASGNENTQFDAYRDPRSGLSVATTQAQSRGYIVASPNGRGPFGGYRGNSEKDVLDVLDRVRAMYPIEDRHTFLTGHSMGAGGTWAIGFKYPAKWAALGPIAGAMTSAEALKAAPEMPVFFAQGAKDTIAQPAGARRLAEAAKPILKNFEYREYPADDHVSIMVTAVPDVYDFFDRIRKSK